MRGVCAAPACTAARGWAHAHHRTPQDRAAGSNNLIGGTHLIANGRDGNNGDAGDGHDNDGGGDGHSDDANAHRTHNTNAGNTINNNPNNDDNRNFDNATTK